MNSISSCSSDRGRCAPAPRPARGRNCRSGGGRRSWLVTSSKWRTAGGQRRVEIVEQGDRVRPGRRRRDESAGSSGSSSGYCRNSWTSRVRRTIAARRPASAFGRVGVAPIGDEPPVAGGRGRRGPTPCASSASNPTSGRPAEQHGRRACPRPGRPAPRRPRPPGRAARATGSPAPARNRGTAAAPRAACGRRGARPGWRARAPSSVVAALAVAAQLEDPPVALGQRVPGACVSW